MPEPDVAEAQGPQRTTPLPAILAGVVAGPPCGEPPPLSPDRGPPPNWGELVQANDDVEIVQIAPDELPLIDIHSL